MEKSGHSGGKKNSNGSIAGFDQNTIIKVILYTPNADSEIYLEQRQSTPKSKAKNKDATAVEDVDETGGFVCNTFGYIVQKIDDVKASVSSTVINNVNTVNSKYSGASLLISCPHVCASECVAYELATLSKADLHDFCENKRQHLASCAKWLLSSSSSSETKESRQHGNGHVIIELDEGDDNYNDPQNVKKRYDSAIEKLLHHVTVSVQKPGAVEQLSQRMDYVGRRCADPLYDKCCNSKCGSTNGNNATLRSFNLTDGVHEIQWDDVRENWFKRKKRKAENNNNNDGGGDGGFHIQHDERPYKKRVASNGGTLTMRLPCKLTLYGIAAGRSIIDEELCTPNAEPLSDGKKWDDVMNVGKESFGILKVKSAESLGLCAHLSWRMLEGSSSSTTSSFWNTTKKAFIGSETFGFCSRDQHGRRLDVGRYSLHPDAYVSYFDAMRKYVRSLKKSWEDADVTISELEHIGGVVLRDAKQSLNVGGKVIMTPNYSHVELIIGDMSYYLKWGDEVRCLKRKKYLYNNTHNALFLCKDISRNTTFKDLVFPNSNTSPNLPFLLPSVAANRMGAKSVSPHVVDMLGSLEKTCDAIWGHNIENAMLYAQACWAKHVCFDKGKFWKNHFIAGVGLYVESETSNIGKSIEKLKPKDTPSNNTTTSGVGQLVRLLSCGALWAEDEDHAAVTAETSGDIHIQLEHNSTKSTASSEVKEGEDGEDVEQEVAEEDDGGMVCSEFVARVLISSGVLKHIEEYDDSAYAFVTSQKIIDETYAISIDSKQKSTTKTASERQKCLFAFSEGVFNIMDSFCKDSTSLKVDENLIVYIDPDYSSPNDVWLGLQLVEHFQKCPHCTTWLHDLPKLKSVLGLCKDNNTVDTSDQVTREEQQLATIYGCRVYDVRTGRMDR